jgi:FkbM family methyltransferase
MLLSYLPKPIKKSIFSGVYKSGLYNWWLSDHWSLGKLVELKGNKVQIDGLQFIVNSPAIKTELKSRFLLNRYEKEEREAIKIYFDPNLPVIELGGCIGVISCLINKQLKSPKKQVVLEANPEMIPLLKINAKLNEAKFEILNLAFGYKPKIDFYLHEKFVGGSAQRVTARKITVPATSLEKLRKKFKFSKFNLICDIEGAEVELFNIESKILQRYAKTIIIEVHPAIVGPKAVKKILNMLDDLKFKCLYNKGQVYVWRNLEI